MGRRVAEAMRDGFTVEAATVLWEVDPELADLRREVIATLFGYDEVLRGREMLRRMANHLELLSGRQATDPNFFIRYAHGDVGLMVANLATAAKRNGIASSSLAEGSRWPVFSRDEGRLLRLLKAEVRVPVADEGRRSRYPALCELVAEGLPNLSPSGLAAALELLKVERDEFLKRVAPADDPMKIPPSVADDFRYFKGVLHILEANHPLSSRVLRTTTTLFLAGVSAKT